MLGAQNDMMIDRLNHSVPGGDQAQGIVMPTLFRTPSQAARPVTQAVT
jgi:hypothetical protein